MEYTASNIEFLGQGLLIKETSDVYFYDSIFKNNAKYYQRKVQDVSVCALSHNEDYVAVTTCNDYYGRGKDNITVCRINGSCFSKI